jgi:hypothetical protein
VSIAKSRAARYFALGQCKSEILKIRSPFSSREEVTPNTLVPLPAREGVRG